MERLTDELGDEKTESDPHRRNEVALVLFRRQHEDREDELRGQDHLDEHALGDCGPAAQRGRNGEFALEQGLHDVRGDYAGYDLDDEEEDPADD